ncbi:hypothetical protein [Kitasatospora brasiliensis]|uniref:hypothetical protein n=1 Tax=Kitasatospora brasiliensis TaxID=3058040 RepID=UPI002930F061|nr:hypothetical protein [Kitasatospora sp. K002]
MTGPAEQADGTTVPAQRSGRHAAPRTPVRVRLRGRALAMAAVPTALLMAAAYTPHPAVAESAAGKPCGTAPAVVPDVAPLETPVPKSELPEPPPGPSGTPSSAPTAPAPTGASTDPGSVPAQVPTTAPAQQPTSPVKPSATGTATATRAGVIDDIIGGLGGLFDPKAPSQSPSQSPSPSPHPTDTPTTAPTAAGTPAAATPQAAPTEAPTATEEPSPTATPSGGPSTKPSPTAKATPSAEATPTEAASPTATPTENPNCDVDARGLSAGAAAPDHVVPEQNWTLLTSRLALHGAVFHGVYDVKTPTGSKRVLKFVVDSVDIDNLDMSTLQGNGVTFHVQGAPGSTSTMREGPVTMYVERLSGHLSKVLGLPLPIDLGEITLTPDTLPRWLYDLIGSIPIPLDLELTGVTAKQAGQFGGTLHIPGMHLFNDNAPYSDK